MCKSKKTEELLSFETKQKRCKGAQTLIIILKSRSPSNENACNMPNIFGKWKCSVEEQLMTPLLSNLSEDGLRWFEMNIYTSSSQSVAIIFV
jgi:hypothetical protein